MLTTKKEKKVITVLGNIRLLRLAGRQVGPLQSKILRSPLPIQKKSVIPFCVIMYNGLDKNTALHGTHNLTCRRHDGIGVAGR